MNITQLHPGAITGEPYGSFIKPVRTEPTITQLHAGAIIGALYGSFTNRIPAPIPLTTQQITTALYGASGTSGGYTIPQQFGWRRKRKVSVAIDDDLYLVEQLC